MVKRIFLTAMPVVILATARCGEEGEPAPAAWELYATFPGTAFAIAVGDSGRTLYAAGTAAGDAVIYKYEDAAFEVEYVAPDDVYLTDVASRAEYRWAGGGRYDANYWSYPFLARYEPSANEWREVAAPATPAGYVAAVLPVGSDDAWLLVQRLRFTNGAPRRGVLVRKRAGEFTAFDDFGDVYLAGAARDYGSDVTIYAVSAREEGPPEVFISADGGASWFCERAAPALPGNFAIRGAQAVCAAGDDLYLIVEFNHRGYMGVVKRTGTPGEGAYKLEFLSTLAPDFECIHDLAVGPSGVGRGVAVGNETSLILAGGRWQVERFTYPVELNRVVAAGRRHEWDNPGGFWALGRNEILETSELYYHR